MLGHVDEWLVLILSGQERGVLAIVIPGCARPSSFG